MQEECIALTNAISITVFSIKIKKRLDTESQPQQAPCVRVPASRDPAKTAKFKV